MQLLLCGVRGSTPALGPEFHAVGGHTSCVAIAGAEGRLLVLDAGTGFRRLADELGDAALRGSVLLTHLHWDHMQGLPFLPNADRPDAEVHLHLPRQGTATAFELLARTMSPPTFPIDPGGLRGSWTFTALDEGRHEIEGFAVTAAAVAHKGGRTFGYRVSDGTVSVAYLPDHAPATATPDELARARALVDGADVVLHGGQFLTAERAQADAFGHATVDDAVALAGDAGAGRLVLLHHAPGRTDEEVAAIASRFAHLDLDVRMGREGDRFEV